MDKENMLIRAQTGDPEAQDQLCRKYWPLICEKADKMINNSDDAKDIAQETLVTAIQKLPQLNDVAAFVGWLNAIMVNKTLDHIHKAQKANRLHELLKDGTIIPEEVNQWSLQTEEPDERLIWLETDQLITGLIKELPPKTGGIVYDRWKKEMNYAELASEHEISDKGVAYHLSSGRKQLRPKLSKRDLLIGLLIPPLITVGDPTAFTKELTTLAKAEIWMSKTKEEDKLASMPTANGLYVHLDRQYSWAMLKTPRIEGVNFNSTKQVVETAATATVWFTPEEQGVWCNKAVKDSMSFDEEQEIENEVYQLPGYPFSEKFSVDPLNGKLRPVWHTYKYELF